MQKHILLFFIFIFALSYSMYAQLPDPPTTGSDDPLVGGEGGLIAELYVTITFDIQPILQLQMETSTQIDFVFDNIQSYHSGITRYGATVLKVSSTVDWDLYAVATSQNGDFWDQQVTYGGGVGSGIDDLPLSLLELRQSQPNSYTDGIVPASGNWLDYSEAFASPLSPVPGQNSIYYNTSPYNAPADDEK